MVSNASELLPEPDKPVKTTILFLGILRSMFFKLWVLAPFMCINSSICNDNGPSNIPRGELCQSSIPQASFFVFIFFTYLLISLFTHSCEWDNNSFTINAIWFCRQADALSATDRKISAMNIALFPTHPPQQEPKDVLKLI